MKNAQTVNKMHFFYHVPFEGAGAIKDWADNKGFKITETDVYKSTDFPEDEGPDWLVIMGGPMNIYEDEKYPWLIKEKEYISKAVRSGKVVIGICLGAQLIASSMGAKIMPSREKEIGWFPVYMTERGRSSVILKGFPDEFVPFHWHGDTFTVPPGAQRVCYSDGCDNQGFIFDDRVIGLQFHLESTMESINKLADNCADEITGGTYMQDPGKMTDPGKINDANVLLFKMLDNILSK